MLSPDTRVTFEGAYIGPIDEDGEIPVDPRKDGAVFFGPDAEANCRRVAACVNACRGLETEALENKAKRLGYFLPAPARKSTEETNDA